MLAQDDPLFHATYGVLGMLQITPRHAPVVHFSSLRYELGRRGCCHVRARIGRLLA